MQDAIMKKSEATRLNILSKAFDLIYERGYKSTSLDDILATTHVTKGAFYYHFKNKDQMGIAILEELIAPTFESTFLQPLQSESDPVELIYDMMYEILINNPSLKVEYGCPAANFTQEMAPWNIDFTRTLNELSERWKQGIVECLEKGKTKRLLKSDMHSEAVAIFIMSGYWGVRNIGKLGNDKSAYLTYLQELKKYLATLRK